MKFEGKVSKRDTRRNSANILVVTLRFTLIFIFFSSIVSATCIIDGKINSPFPPFNPDYALTALCANTEEINYDNLHISPGTIPYLVSFGSQNDNCEDYCGTVILQAQNISLGVGATLPLNNSNVPDWNLVSDGFPNSVHFNLTMDAEPDTTPPQFTSSFAPQNILDNQSFGFQVTALILQGLEDLISMIPDSASTARAF